VLINYRDSLLSISNLPESDLASLKIQLDVYGFQYNSDAELWELTLNQSFETIFDLLKTLEDRGHQYILGEELENEINRFQKKQEEYLEVRELARKYKNGDLDNLSSDFAEYLNTLPRTLRDHQEKAAHHLYLINNGANFSVPGAGKTTVVLSVYSKNKQDKKVNCLFVVGPTACFYSWINEYSKTLGQIPNSIILSGLNAREREQYYYLAPENRPELYILSFQTLCNDISHISKMFKMQRNDIYFVVDEAHYVKRLGGPWANAVLEASQYANKRCVLTGTPLPHSYTDLYNIFDVLWPNQFPIELSTRIYVENLIKEKNDSKINEIVEEKIGPLFYRVRKKDLGLAPQHFNSPIKIEMKEHEKYLYDSVMQRISQFDRNNYMHEKETLDRLKRGRLIRLRQAVSYPKLLSSAVNDYDESLFNTNSNIEKVIHEYDELEKPAKLEKLIEIVKDFQKKKLKVVIWTNFIGTLKLICNEAEEMGFNVEAIWGGVPIEKEEFDETKTREEIRREFVSSDSGLDILVANPAACSESISLHKTCFNAIYYDLSYNCAQYVQSLDRIHRVGGSEDKAVNYYYLQYERTIENKIMDNLEEKRRRMAELIEKDYSIYSLDMFEIDNTDIDIYDSILVENE
jgi:superfamily II DNA or RNA helicase